jgi:hypothetical protein
VIDFTFVMDEIDLQGNDGGSNLGWTLLQPSISRWGLMMIRRMELTSATLFSTITRSAMPPAGGCQMTSN